MTCIPQHGESHEDRRRRRISRIDITVTACEQLGAICGLFRPSPRSATVRYQPVDTQPKFVAIDLVAQLLPGTFEHALRQLFEQATFIALSGDSRPHFTTIAHFVSSLGEQIAPIVAAVLAICDRQGLIGREMFAIDGVKLPSHASKHGSRTRADFERQAEKMERAAEAMLARHRAEDAQAVEPTLLAKDVARRGRLVQDAAELRTWLTRHPDDRRGASAVAGSRCGHRARVARMLGAPRSRSAPKPALRCS